MLRAREVSLIVTCVSDSTRARPQCLLLCRNTETGEWEGTDEGGIVGSTPPWSVFVVVFPLRRPCRCPSLPCVTRDSPSLV